MDTGCRIPGVMHTQVAKELSELNKVQWLELPRPEPVRAFDGQPTKPITHKIMLPMTVGQHYQRQMVFMIADLGTHPIILGDPWFAAHDAYPDCRTRSIAFRGDCYHDQETPNNEEGQTTQIEAQESTDRTRPPTTKPGDMLIMTRPTLDPDQGRNGKPMTDIAVARPRLPLEEFMRDNSSKPGPETPDSERLDLPPKQTSTKIRPPPRKVTAPAIPHRDPESEDESDQSNASLSSEQLPRLPQRDRLHRARKRKQYRESQKLKKRLHRPGPDDTPADDHSLDTESLNAEEVTESAGISAGSPEASGAHDICAINAASFYWNTKQEGTEVFVVSLQDISDHNTKQAKTETDPKTKLPSEFHGFLPVFSKANSNRLSEPRKPFDHHIELVREASSLRQQPLRRTSEEENRVIQEYLNENLAKGWIRPSSAAYASPILMVKKPSGGLRVCVDYRRLNEITRKDRYPLPLIEETLTRVLTARWYSKIDLRSAFHRLRMATKDDEDLTTFMTRHGNFAYRVLPFGLSGGPASFQRFMNESFWEMLDDFVSIYLDDILIYSKTREDHHRHIGHVLQRLKDIGVEADIDKCEFYTQEIKYLGVVLTPAGIRMDPTKVQAIQDWERPTSGRDITGVRRFIGFCNYYRRFIKGFSRIARPLNALLNKDSDGEWTVKCQQSFEDLKRAIATEPVLQHFDPAKQSYVECDASDTCTGGILSQQDADGQLRPVAFFSCSMSPAERNYAIYDKELLAIVRSFEAWRPELAGTEPDKPVKILTDHKALEYFQTTKQLTGRQARWAETLSGYNFIITYRPGAQNGKADALTRRDTQAKRSEGDPNRNQVLLPPELFVPEHDRIVAPVALDASWVDEVLQANRSSPEFDEIRRAIEIGQEDKVHGYSPQACKDRDGLLIIRDHVAVPNHWTGRVIKKIHESPEVGHSGAARTAQAIQRSFDWPGLWATVQRFCRNCHICGRAKPRRQAPAGLLTPLDVPDRPWRKISLDFVTGLPPSKEGYNCILNVVCRLTKMRHCIPCRAGDDGLSAEETAKLIFRHVWRLHGFPDDWTSDRDPRFTGLMMQHLCRIIGIDIKMSTAFHPETDGQTEIVNQEIERYLRTYVNYLQDDWVEWLPQAEFAANAAASATTTVTPFFANYGYEPRMSFDTNLTNQQGDTARERVELTKANELTIKMKSVWDWTGKQMQKAQERMKRYADQGRSDKEFTEGDRVYVSARNIHTLRPCKKLDDKWYGPFKILKRLKTAYRVDLPSSMKIHNVFHASLLAKDPGDPLPEQEYPQPEPVIINGEKEWEVDDILDVRKKPGRTRALEVQVAWNGFDRDNNWYPIDDFDHCADILNDFYTRHPSKPKPTWLLPPTTSAIGTIALLGEGGSVTRPIQASFRITCSVV